MNTVNKDVIFSKQYMSFEEMILCCDKNCGYITKIMETKRFHEDKMLDFDIKVNGVDIDIKVFEKYIDTLYKTESKRHDEEKKEINDMRQNIEEVINNRVNKLVEERISNIYDKMTEKAYDLKEEMMCANHDIIEG